MNYASAAKRINAYERLIRLDKPVGALLLATGWSGGSMAPPGLPEVKPPEFLTQQVVASGIIAAAARAQPADPAGACRHFLGLAWDVATGRNRWQPQ